MSVVGRWGGRSPSGAERRGDRPKLALRQLGHDACQAIR